MADKSYKSKTKIDISNLVYARQKTYMHSTEIFIPDKPYEKLQDGYELSTESRSSGQSTPTSEEEKIERSRRRTYIAVKDIALSNVFTMFVTFTFSEDRFDNEQSRKKMNGWLKRQRKIDKSFQYLIVSELHKKCEECAELRMDACTHDDRPKAIHYHALVGGYEGKLVRVINPKTNKPMVKRGRKVYDFPHFTLGNSEVYLIGDSDQDRIRSGFYLLKYLKKDLTNFKNKKRYWASRGLNKARTIENPDEWYLFVVPDHAIRTPFGMHLYFDNQRINEFL